MMIMIMMMIIPSSSSSPPPNVFSFFDNDNDGPLISNLMEQGLENAEACQNSLALGAWSWRHRRSATGRAWCGYSGTGRHSQIRPNLLQHLQPISPLSIKETIRCTSHLHGYFCVLWYKHLYGLCLPCRAHMKRFAGSATFWLLPFLFTWSPPHLLFLRARAT